MTTTGKKTSWKTWVGGWMAAVGAVIPFVNAWVHTGVVPDLNLVFSAVLSVLGLGIVGYTSRDDNVSSDGTTANKDKPAAPPKFDSQTGSPLPYPSS